MAYLFVDAGYLRPEIEAWSAHWHGRSDLEFDPFELGRTFQKCFFYDCAPAKRASESDIEFEARATRAEAHVRKIKSTNGWHVYEGTLRRHRGRLTQKEVDVAIAVDLMSHTHRKNTDEMSLIAGDLDFRPVVDAVVRDGMYLRLIHGPKASQDLMDSADARLEMTPYVIQSWMPLAFQAANQLPGQHFATMTLSDHGFIPIERGFHDNVNVVRALRRENDGQFFVCGLVPDQDAPQERRFMFTSGGKLDQVKKMYAYHTGEDYDWQPLR